MPQNSQQFTSIEYCYTIEDCASVKVTCPLRWLPRIEGHLCNDDVSLFDLNNFTLRMDYFHYGVRSYIFCYETLKGREFLEDPSREKVFEGHMKDAVVLIYATKTENRIKTSCKILSYQELTTTDFAKILDELKLKLANNQSKGNALEVELNSIGTFNFSVTKNLLTLPGNAFPDTLHLKIRPYRLPASFKKGAENEQWLPFNVAIEPHFFTLDADRMHRFLKKSSWITITIGNISFSYYTTSSGKYLALESIGVPNNRYFSVVIKTKKKFYNHFVSAYEKVVRCEFFPFINAVIATPPPNEITNLLYLYHL